MDKTIGERIQALRAEQGYNQKDFCIKAGIVEASLSRYENSKREPKLSTLHKLADALGTTTDYLCGRTDIKYGSIHPVIELDQQSIDIASEIQACKLQGVPKETIITILRQMENVKHGSTQAH